MHWHSSHKYSDIALSTLCYQLQYTGVCFGVHEKTSLIDKLMCKKTYVKSFPTSLVNLVLLDAFCNLYPGKIFTDDDYSKIAHAIVLAMVTFFAKQKLNVKLFFLLNYIIMLKQF